MGVTDMRVTITPLQGALGATVEGLDVDNLDAEIVEVLRDAWHKHLVLFFPKIDLSPAQQSHLASQFGSRLAATTETGDYRNAPSLADEGFPQILLLDTGLGHKPKVTANWHTDVTFSENPPIGSLFCMEIAAQSGGDTMWSNQYAALEKLSSPIRSMISGLQAAHGRPPLTQVANHPMVKVHPGTGKEVLFVNRGWTKSIPGLTTTESDHLLAMINETAEQPELQIRWKWSSGDAALWDNRCTMHYAVNDYGTERRRARRATIYN